MEPSAIDRSTVLKALYGTDSPEIVSRLYGSHPRKMGWVYFAGSADGRFIKIGYTRTPKTRLKALNARSAPHRSFCPSSVKFLGLIRGTTADERHLHKLFNLESVGGEWFNYSESIMWWMRFLKAVPIEAIAA